MKKWQRRLKDTLKEMHDPYVQKLMLGCALILLLTVWVLAMLFAGVEF